MVCIKVRVCVCVCVCVWGGGGGGGCLYTYMLYMSESFTSQCARIASFPGLRLFRLREGKSQGLVSKVT